MFGGAVQTRRVYEQIASHIERLIQRGELRPGDRLPSERDLARQLAVSRPSVREAVIALEMAGLLEVRVGDATYVRENQPGETTVPPDNVGLVACPVFEQIEASALFEVELAGDAARHRDARTVSAIEHALLGEIRDKLADGFAAPVTRAFHHSVVRGSNNALLASLALGLWSMRAGADWGPHRIAVNAFDEDAVLRQERDILHQAIKAGRERDARASMARTHDRFRWLIFGETKALAAR